jgi:hypothetical protein
VTDDTNPWAECASRVTALRPPALAQCAAFRALVWLAGERAAVPHDVRLGRRRAVLFRWDQGGHWFEVSVTVTGKARWRAGAAGGAGPGGQRLDRSAAEALRTAIPFSGRFPNIAAEPPPNGRPVGRSR